MFLEILSVLALVRQAEDETEGQKKGGELLHALKAPVVLAARAVPANIRKGHEPEKLLISNYLGTTVMRTEPRRSPETLGQLAAERCKLTALEFWLGQQLVALKCLPVPHLLR